MKKIESVLDFPNNIWGEDRVFFYEKIAGVIDGSTPIDALETKGYHSQASWLADKLKEQVSDKSDFNVVESFYEVINNYHKDNDILKLKTENRPSAVMASIEEKDDKIILSIIGDCTAVVYFIDNRIKIFSDKRIRVFSQKTKDAKLRALASGNNVKDAVNTQMKENRKYMNVENGFWTIAFKNDFRKEVKKYEINKADVYKVLLFTDGFERIFTLSEVSLKQIFEEKVSLKSCIKILRNIENQLESSQNSEVKKQDDAAAILIQLN
ncbi:hypothetical protein GTN31_02385 [Macrococcoides canis]|uniref:hypothetical protein n=1 Tax=Macrococcoides canis TaxID=1855823 RepID=UPI0013E922CA|nr:hypothetical protein [Macrococcus canis]QIH75185.1 hypothetical protein GTN31_02385 [Macrococcus canis]